MGPLSVLMTAVGLLGVPAAATAPVAPVGVEIVEVATADHPSIDITVTVTGDIDVDAASESLVVTEAGVPLDITRITPATSAGMEVMLVMDESGSMSGAPLEAARQAAHSFVDGLSDEIRVGVVGFGSVPELLQSPTAKRDKVHAAIDRLTAQGETALYDGVRYAVHQFSTDAAVRRMVLLSDGGDTVSRSTLDDAIRSTQDVTVDVVELVTNESNRANLDGIADDAVRSVTDPSLLTSLYDDVAASFAQQLVVRALSQSFGATDLAVSIETPAGIVEAQRSVRLPDEPLPTTTVPTPVTTSASAVTAAGQPNGQGTNGTVVTSGGSSDGSSSRPYIGAALVMAGLLVLVVTVRSGPSRSAVVRSRLEAATAKDTAEVRPRRGVLDVVDDILDRRGKLAGLDIALRRAGMTTSPAELVLTTALGALIGAAVLGVLVHPLLGLAVLVIVPLTVRSVVNHKIRKRRERFTEQLPDVLQLIQSMLTSGFGLLQALKATSEQVAEPARSCFAQAMFAARSGRDIADALHDVGDEMQSSDFDWVVTAIEINREIGGDLSSILGSVAEGVRERQRLRGQVKALTAEGRLSAYVMLALPPGVLAVSSMSNPDYVSRLFEGAGLILLATAITLMAVGFLWMRKMINKVMA